jgi:uncharacterized protein (DUF433 family)
MRGIVHGKTIEVEGDFNLPEGQPVTVIIQAEDELPKWLERFTVDPSVALGKLLIKGTRLLVDDLVRLVEEGRSDEELRRLHRELTAEDVNAVREYAKVPAGVRESFGGWAADAEELDRYLEWNHQQHVATVPGLSLQDWPAP